MPVTGTGSNLGENKLIYDMLRNDVAERKYALVKNRNNADYLLIGTISFTDEIVTRNPNIRWEQPLFFILSLELQDSNTQVTIAEQKLHYNNLDDIRKMFPYLMYDIFFQPLAKTQADRSWQNNWFYLGANVYWTPRIYEGMDQSFNFSNFGGGVSLEWHFLPFMTLETGAEIVSDWLTVYDGSDIYFRELLLEIPLLVKWVIKPSDKFALEPYGGMYYNISLANITATTMFSWTAGLRYNLKIPHAGILYIDPRFSMDIGDSYLDTGYNNDLIRYSRYIMHFGIGYKFGFAPKRK